MLGELRSMAHWTAEHSHCRTVDRPSLPMLVSVGTMRRFSDHGCRFVEVCGRGTETLRPTGVVCPSSYGERLKSGRV